MGIYKRIFFALFITSLTAPIFAIAPGDKPVPVPGELPINGLEEERVEIADVGVVVYEKEKDLKKDDKQYVSIGIIRPGQIRISQAGVQEKVAEAINKGYARVKPLDPKIRYFREPEPTYILKFDNGLSIIPDTNPLPVVKVKIDEKVWYILLDGHHDYLSNKKLGGKTVFIEVKDDLSNIPENALWQVLKAKGYIYAQNLAGKEVIPLPESFDQLEDDPYRFFMKGATWKCKNTEDNAGQPGTKYLQYPLGIKWVAKNLNPRIVKKDGKEYQINLPFIEFKVADILYKYAQEYGFDYTPGDEKDKEKLEKLVEIARQILNDHPVKSFNFVPTKTAAKDINDGKICEYVYISEAQEAQPEKKPLPGMPLPPATKKYSVSVDNVSEYISPTQELYVCVQIEFETGEPVEICVRAQQITGKYSSASKPVSYTAWAMNNPDDQYAIRGKIDADYKNYVFEVYAEYDDTLDEKQPWQRQRMRKVTIRERTDADDAKQQKQKETMNEQWWITPGDALKRSQQMQYTVKEGSQMGIR